jgi:hypothetical protein
MGMREDIQADLAEAFNDPDGLADAVQAFTGGITLPGTWDPVAEAAGEPIVIAYTGRGIFGSFNKQLVDGIQILATDVSLLALQNETTGLPAVDHEINDLKVISVSQDPASATWTLQLRKV